jgi:hypothetical protein
VAISPNGVCAAGVDARLHSAQQRRSKVRLFPLGTRREEEAGKREEAAAASEDVGVKEENDKDETTSQERSRQAGQALALCLLNRTDANDVVLVHQLHTPGTSRRLVASFSSRQAPADTHVFFVPVATQSASHQLCAPQCRRCIWLRRQVSPNSCECCSSTRRCATLALWREERSVVMWCFDLPTSFAHWAQLGEAAQLGDSVRFAFLSHCLPL